MKVFWTVIKKHKILSIVFVCVSILAGIYLILRRSNITHLGILGYEASFAMVIVSIPLVLGSILWILVSPTLSRVFLLAALGLTTLGLYATTLGGNIFYAAGGILLIGLTGFSFFAKRKLIFIIAYPLYYILGMLLFGFFDWGHFLLHFLGFGMAVLGLFVREKKFNYLLAGSSLVIPVWAFALLALLTISDNLQSPIHEGEISSPFEERLIFVQKTVSDFDDAAYILEIYAPRGGGFFQQIGSHRGYDYVPELSEDDFLWETVDEENYVLHFYDDGGNMQYSLLISL